MPEAHPIFLILDIFLEDGLVTDAHLKRDAGLVSRKDLFTSRGLQILPLNFEPARSQGLSLPHKLRQGVPTDLLNFRHGRDRRGHAIIEAVRAVLPEMPDSPRALAQRLFESALNDPVPAVINVAHNRRDADDLAARDILSPGGHRLRFALALLAHKNLIAS